MKRRSPRRPLITVEIAVSKKLDERMGQEGMEPLECVFITGSDIRHIKRSHSENRESLGQASIRREDFAALPEVLGDFETCEHTDTDRLGN